jgi:CHAT domain-containing protein
VVRLSLLLGLTIAVFYAPASIAAESPPSPDPRACAPPPPPPAPTTELGRGNAALAAGREADALAHFRSAASEAKMAGDEPARLLAEASALRVGVLGDAAPASLDEARALLAAASELDSAGLRAPLELHLGRSLLLLAWRQPELRDEAMRLATSALQSADEGAEAAGDTRLASYASGNRAELALLEAERPSEGATPLDDALGQARRALYLAQHAGDRAALFRWQALLGRIHARRGDLEAAVGAYRRAVTIYAEARAEVGSPTPDLSGATDTPPRSVHVSLVDLLLQLGAKRSDDAQQPLLREARAHLEARKAAELRDHFRDPCLDAHRKAEPDEVPGTLLVYPVALDDRLELIVSRDGRFHRFTSAVGRADFDATVHAFRRNLEKRTTRQYLRQAIQLHEWIVRPLLPLLEDPTTRSLVLVPEGSLRTIPIAALRESPDGRFLIERIPVSVTPVLTLTEPRPISPSGTRMLAAGISESVAGFPALPQVQVELAELSQIYPGRVILDEAFSHETLTSEIRQHAYGVVHIASHGEFRADTRESFLLAHDDKIAMDELAAMLAATRFRGEGVQLLTLSACQSAAGDERAALGLAGVAVNAGARSALATLWNINDEVAAELVASFYTALKRPGTSRAEALRQAQVEVLKRANTAHPGYWAAFLLIGNWM